MKPKFQVGQLAITKWLIYGQGDSALIEGSQVAVLEVRKIMYGEVRYKVKSTNGEFWVDENAIEPPIGGNL